jgi:hypothetical protein
MATGKLLYRHRGRVVEAIAQNDLQLFAGIIGQRVPLQVFARAHGGSV